MKNINWIEIEYWFVMAFFIGPETNRYLNFYYRATSAYQREKQFSATVAKRQLALQEIRLAIEIWGLY